MQNEIEKLQNELREFKLLNEILKHQNKILEDSVSFQRERVEYFKDLIMSFDSNFLTKKEKNSNLKIVR